MADQIVAYRAASEALHRDPVAERQAIRFRKLWECGFADLIRADFYRLLALPEGVRGELLDAGCGNGIDAANLRRLAPGLRVHGVDISSVALAGVWTRSAAGEASFYQAALERLPLADSVFDYIASHEVIEHVEDPAPVLRELYRVLKPGGVCAIATPNGASLWIEHLRQRAMRLCGRRGAPVGADHTRSPSFWRRQFRGAGFVVEQQIFDGAALEFQLFVAPAKWMPLLSRLFEPLRVVPLVRWLLCDRVKFRLSKPGARRDAAPEVTTCGPVRHTELDTQGSMVVCRAGPRLARTSAGLIDFTAFAATEPAMATEDPGGPALTGIEPPVLRRRLRRGALLGLSFLYAGFLMLLAPLGLAVSGFHQPFRR